MFYADSTFNEYFQRPETNKTCSNCKSVSWIRNAAELSALCKTYEDYKKVVITYYVVMFVDWDGTVLKT